MTHNYPARRISIPVVLKLGQVTKPAFHAVGSNLKARILWFPPVLFFREGHLAWELTF